MNGYDLVWLANFRIFKRLSAKKGVSIVEFALTLPVLFLAFVGFVHVLTDINIQTRHASAAHQLNMIFKGTPLKVTTINEGTEFRVDLRRLSSDELSNTDKETGLLYNINQQFNAAMAASGTFASFITSNIMARLVYICIVDPETDHTQDSTGCPEVPSSYLNDLERWSGHSYVADEKLAYSVDASHLYHTDPGPTNGDSSSCFGVANSPKRTAYEAGFEAFVSDRLTMIKNATDLPFGTLVLDVSTGINAQQQLVSYLQWRPVLFLRMCSKIPRLIWEKEDISDFVYFFDHEVSTD